MQCTACHRDNPAGMKFCGECGARLAVGCPSCGALSAPTQKFCGECGTRLMPGPMPGKPSAPDTYTPAHLAEKILKSKGALEGERKQVTVLFADMTASMELMAARDPEEARKILDPVLERMMEAVHRYEGTVNQVMGDGIMALFGAPLANEDHAVRACYAALRMQEAVKRYAEGVHREYGVTVRIRVGLNSGEVVVRAIGSDLHMDYTAVGQTTHLAARMEQLAPPGAILVPAAMQSVVEGYVETRSLGERTIKGIEAPVEVYEITGPGSVRSRLHAAAARGLSPFVGRAAEMEHLTQALARAAAGHGQVVGVVAEPGVGKSRLYWEFTHSRRTAGWLLVESRSLSYGKATPYLPVSELLRTYFRIETRDNPQSVRAKVTERVLALDRRLESALAPVLSLLDVPVEDETWERLDPPQRRQRTLDAVKRLLLRESQGQPLLVLFEDLHWIDAETQALLDGLVESLPTARILLLVNYRPEYHHGWGGKSYYLPLRLDPLPPERTDELLHTLLGADPALEPVKRLLAERTEGNPFFLEESVRTLVETRVLVGRHGAYRPAPGAELVDHVLRIPAAARDVVAARVDRLAPEDKRLLQAASVIGKDVPCALLEAIADLPVEVVRQGLTSLQAQEYLHEARLFPDLEYTFRHALTHEVVYASVLHDRRRALHARIVEAIERLSPGRLVEHVERLAHHAVRGEVWPSAVAYLRGAGAKAFGRSANRESAAYFEQALAALAHLPEGRETVEQAIDIRLDLRNSLQLLGDLDKVVRHLQEAEPHVRALADPRRLGWWSAYMGHYFWITARAAEARAFGQRSVALAEQVDDLPLRVAANLYYGLACNTAGDYRLADSVLRTIVQVLEGDVARERFGQVGFPVVTSRCYLVYSLAERGEFAEGIALGREGLRLARELDHPYSVGLMSWNLARLYTAKGELEAARQLIEESHQLSRQGNFVLSSPRTTWSLGHLAVLEGRIAEGLVHLEQALEAFESVGMRVYQSMVAVHLGEAYVEASRLDEARTCAARALALARERGQRGHLAYALHLAGELEARTAASDARVAQASLREALMLATELGMQPLAARCHLGLGTLLRRSGDAREASEHLGAAVAMFEAMEMPRARERALAPPGA